MKLITDYLYPLKGSMLAERYAQLELADHELEIAVTEGGVIVPPTLGWCNETCVVDRRGEIVAGSVMDAEEEFLQSVAGLDLKDIEPEQDLTVLYGGYFNTHWGHFLTETLSRLWPLFRVRIDKIVYCLHPGEKPSMTGNVGEALRLLGIENKIEFISQPTRYRRVLTGETGVYPRAIFATDVKPVYDALVEAAMKETSASTVYGPKLYMSRSRLPKALKNEAGLDRLDSIMSEAGFDVIYPEKMDLVSFIKALQGAREVATVSGTLPHNLLLGRDGTRLIIFEKHPTINTYQPGIDRLRHLEVTPVDCGAFIRPVSVGLGPFIIYPTDQLRAWARDCETAIPAPLSNRERRDYLRKFFRQFSRNYHERWIMPHWLVDETAICCEAYRQTEATFGPWLDGLRPLTLWQALSPRRIARVLKRRLRK